MARQTTVFMNYEEILGESDRVINFIASPLLHSTSNTTKHTTAPCIKMKPGYKMMSFFIIKLLSVF